MRIGVTYTYMGVEGECWGYSQYESNSLKNAECQANQEHRNLENFKIQEISTILEGKTKEYYDKKIFLRYQNVIFSELETMTCASSKEFEAGYKMAIQDVKKRIKSLFKQK
jgi:hypothetical protein